jgi:hypothetical protein
MKFDLAQMTATKRPSGRPIDLPPIVTTTAQANDLAKIYMQVVNAWKEAATGITEAYATELERILTTDSPDQVRTGIDGVADSLQRLVLQLTPATRDWAFRIEDWHRGKWERGVLSTTGIDLSTMIGPLDARDTIEASVARNVSLVRDVSEETRRRITDAVFRGFQQRTPAKEVGKEITEAVGMARRRANRIAADQTVKLGSALDAERQRQAGLDHWKWRHSGKLHPRLDHKARDGNVYTDENAPKDLPGQLPYCGCVRQGIVVFEGEEPAQPPKPPRSTPRAIRPRQSKAEKAFDNARNYVLTKGRAQGIEHLVAYDASDGQVLHRLAGRRRSVAISRELQRDLDDGTKSIVLHHNHPSSSSLSQPDLDVLTSSPGAKGIWAHGHNGSDFYAEKGEISLNKRVIDAVAGMLQTKVQGLINARLVTVEDAQLLHNHLVWLKIHKFGQIRYTATLRGPSLEAWNRNEDIWKRLVDADE